MSKKVDDLDKISINAKPVVQEKRLKFCRCCIDLNVNNDVNIFKSMPTSRQDSIYRAEDDNLILGKIICFMICSLCLLCVMSL